MVAGVTTRKWPRWLDSAQWQEDDGLGAHRGEGAHSKAWQRTAASSGAARSPATDERGTAAPAAAVNGDLRGGR
jgi:hypothetical protein